MKIEKAALIGAGAPLSGCNVLLCLPGDPLHFRYSCLPHGYGSHKTLRSHPPHSLASHTLLQRVWSDDIKREIWRAGDTMYYKQGVTDPDYCILKFTAIKGRHYGGRSPAWHGCTAPVGL